MKFIIEIDSERNPDAVGEYLRSEFFDEKIHHAGTDREYRETGCYTTHDWQEDVEPLAAIQQEDFTCPGCDKASLVGYAGGEPSHDYTCACTSKSSWTRGKKRFQHPTDAGLSDPTEIECRWWWDGDGVLAFRFPDGSFLVNNDCKKDHGWFITQNETDF